MKNLSHKSNCKRCSSGAPNQDPSLHRWQTWFTGRTTPLSNWTGSPSGSPGSTPSTGQAVCLPEQAKLLASESIRWSEYSDWRNIGRKITSHLCKLIGGNTVSHPSVFVQTCLYLMNNDAKIHWTHLMQGDHCNSSCKVTIAKFGNKWS
jgi:hypothetical protein